MRINEFKPLIEQKRQILNQSPDFLLTSKAEHSDPQKRKEAMQTLGNLGVQALPAVPDIMRRLVDTEKDVIGGKLWKCFSDVRVSFLLLDVGQEINRILRAQ